MNKPPSNLFTTRPAYVLELPLKEGVRILHPEQVILKIGSDYREIGAFCYSLRSDKRRKPGQPTEVVLSSFLKQRPKQMLQAIKVLSAASEGKAPATVSSSAFYLKTLLDWADANDHSNCLAGGDATHNAFRAYAADVADRFGRQGLSSNAANRLQTEVCALLVAITGVENLARGVRIIKNRDWANGGTKPVPDHEFAHMLAMSMSLFDGLCDLVLNHRPFPYKLDLPKSLGWEQNHLWVFPTRPWYLPPHQWDPSVRKNLGTNASWPYDYQHGRLATEEEIWYRYKAPTQRAQRDGATYKIRAAKRRLDTANADPHNHWRFKLGMLAHNAFCWLLHANSGGNQQPILDLETDGTVETTVAQQGFRNTKFRAAGAKVFIPIPAKFLPSLRKFMKLRAWLLDGTFCPYLFFTFGNHRVMPTPQRAHDLILWYYIETIRRIDPSLKPILAQKTRATVNDSLLRKNDASVVSKILGHTEATELAKYGRGSPVDHRDELTFVLEKISMVAKRQAVTLIRADLGKQSKPLEQGGSCTHYGHPEAMTDEPALRPDCAGGCWFCNHRMLVADELDARKVASAAFVMEQLILGSQHEAKLRPLIVKCETDLDCIAQTNDCHVMVEQVRRDVFEDGNLTSFWAEKYHLFLELGVIV
ncbi:TPA: hypothetical protein I7E53_004031 [Vibrio cholerae]|nr:hypothetical protein [Vibrio cholerae]HAS5616686.1 hypothetical protein [Vibrio cholerae]HAS5623888.1 hypothetical protein [Vibrio cholerae]HAS5624403.1 hypothetical protein [Vibrio cholerae]